MKRAVVHATQIEPGTAAHEHSEIIEVHWIPFAEAYEWAMNGQIRDAKTIIALARTIALAAVRDSEDVHAATQSFQAE